jgi:hypothetical protein
MKALTTDELQNLLKEPELKTKKQTNRDSNVKKKQIIDEIKSQPCADCKNKFPPYVMEFDHLESRNGEPTIAASISKLGIQRLLEEIEKCDLVCANCHKIRTYNRRNNKTA